jgi:hypothetical protein
MPSATHSTVMLSLRSAISQCRLDDGNWSLNGVSHKFMRPRKLLTSFTVAHCPKIHGINSKDAIFSSESESGW